MIVKTGRYRHYKGKEYQVLGMATHSESLEELVIYKQLYGNYGIWARPAAMWNDIIDLGGTLVPRFQYIGDTDSTEQQSAEAEENKITELWHHGTEEDWLAALSHYDSLYRHKDIELYMENLDYRRVEKMTPEEFYIFLRDKYFVWKYTDARRLKRLRETQLVRHSEGAGLAELAEIKEKLFGMNRNQTREMLKNISDVHGLGIAGASGLLAVLFPEQYGTVDQFVVLALQRVISLPEHDSLSKINPNCINIADGVLLETIMRGKAEELNSRFHTDIWTPRKIDKVLWAYGRK